MHFSSRRGISSSVTVVVIVAIVLVAAGVYYGLNYGGGATPTTSSHSTLGGAGSTFVFPVMSAMIIQYETLKPNVQVNYQSIGSGGGIAAIQGHTVDFAASDAPLKGSDITNTPNALTMPVTIGAVTVAYNIPHTTSGVHFSGQVLADIFAGNVTYWDDPAILNLNQNLVANLTHHSILVIHRSDGSGTTFTFTGFLSADSAGWQEAVGQGKTVAWPVGIGANGNAGVASVVQGTQYTIGYVELAYALQNKMAVAAVKNPEGTFVLPTLDTSASAAQSIPALPAGNGDWSSVNLLNQPGTNSYPIVTFVYVFVYKELNVDTSMTQSKAAALVQFLWWVVHTGQGQANALSYVPLPANVVALDEQTIQSITFNGQTLPTT